MPDGAELTDVETVREEGSWLCTVTDESGDEHEVLLVSCEDGGDPVRAWSNRCTHQEQRLDTGRGAAMRDGQIVCPRHGSMFDACSGDCDNGPAADTTLPAIEVTVEDGTVYLADESYEFAHAGEIEDDDGPGSTSHIGF